jgi:DDE domain
VIDVLVSQRRDIASAQTFFTAALAVHGDPGEVVTDRAPALANVIEELLPAAWHNTGQYQNNRVECDHGRLKARLRLMRGLKSHRTASVVIRGHAFIQNLRRDHDELAVEATRLLRLATAFDEHTGHLISTGAQVPPQHDLRSNNATEPSHHGAARDPVDRKHTAAASSGGQIAADLPTTLPRAIRRTSAIASAWVAPTTRMLRPARTETPRKAVACGARAPMSTSSWIRPAATPSA